MRRNIQTKNQIIIKYIQDNIKEITTIAIIFLIGIIFGIMLINNVKQERKRRTWNLRKSIYRKYKTGK